MGTLWFCLVALMIAIYVLLDGFDLGAGAIHLFVAKTDEERRQVLASIGPVWDGNEVWLIDRKSTRLNSSHGYISYAVFCLKKKKKTLVRQRDAAAQDYLCTSSTDY